MPDQEKRRTDKAYAKVKSLQYKPKTKNNIVKDENGRALFENHKVGERWKQYIEDLYKGTDIVNVNGNTFIEKAQDVGVDVLGPSVSRHGFDAALINLVDNKGTGVDQIAAEILKNMSRKMNEQFFKVITECYEKGTVPADL